VPSILVVDDDPLITNGLQSLLEHHDYSVRVVQDPLDVPEAAREVQPDAVILDLEMPGRDGLDLLPDIQRISPRSEVIVYTGTGDIPKAVQATKLGAYDFIEKDLEPERVLLSLERALEARRQAEENVRLRQSYNALAGYSTLLVLSQATEDILALADRYRRSPEVSVLVEGESGTGKELIARYIHGPDNASPFVAINCGAIPEGLVESELFGYVPGAFTGARAAGAPGKIQSAEGGTLFLDEIGDLDLNAQVKLLRFLEQGTFFPVGGTEEKHVRLRVICATNCDLAAAIADGAFRRDLYYRVNVGHIRVPPLRERREEIVPFARHFLREFSERFHNPFRNIHPDAEALLENAPWQGNVRELRHSIERVVLIEEGPTILPQHLAFLESDAPGRTHRGPRPYDQPHPPEPPIVQETAAGDRSPPAEAPLPEEGIDLEGTMLRLIERALEQNNHNQTQTARYLNISRETLRYRLGKLKKARSEPS
jgi:DNA-binding NtrC family response regulator